MLDLNIELVDNSSCDIEHETKMTTTTTEEKATECDDSGSSSVVEVLSSDRSSIPLSVSLFDFGILSKGEGLRIEEDCGEDSTTPLLVTRQLFPVARGSGVGDSSPESKSLLRPQWLNLSGSGSDQMIKFQQKQQQQVVKKSRRGPRSRSSQYRGVTFYRRTGRWESHIWDCGKQVYLGGFDSALAAARVYDRAAIKFRGADADINFNLCDYEEDMYQMNNMSKEEFVHVLRRRNTRFSRGISKYRGVTLHKCGRWEARMGQFLGKKYIYLGLFDTEIEAARSLCSKAYDKEAIRCHGREAVTNFKASSYAREMSLDANNLGGRTAQNLDLNLWSSPPTDVPKAKTNIRDFQLLFAASEMPAGKRPRVSVPLKHHIHNL